MQCSLCTCISILLFCKSYSQKFVFVAQGDFTGISKVNAEPIIFANGQISTTVEITITDDHLVEGSEHFSAHIISGGGISDLVIFASKVTVNITDNDGQ